jgi:hypothetical protein
VDRLSTAAAPLTHKATEKSAAVFRGKLKVLPKILDHLIPACLPVMAAKHPHPASAEYGDGVSLFFELPKGGQGRLAHWHDLDLYTVNEMRTTDG